MVLTIAIFAVTVVTGGLTLFFAFDSVRKKISIQRRGSDVRATVLWGLITSILTIIQLVMALQDIHIANLP